MRKEIVALSALLLSLTLTACAGNKPEIKTVLTYPPIENSQLTCQAEPLPDEYQADKSQEDFAIYAQKVREAGQDCRKVLNGLRAYIYSWQNDVDMMDIWYEEGMYNYGTEE